MECLRHYTFFGLLFVIYSVDSAYSRDNVYEKISAYVQDSDYVDPQSLYYNRESQTVKAPKSYMVHTESEDNQLSVRGSDRYQSCKDNTYEVFSRRLVNMIISKSNFKIYDGLASGKLELEATVEELNFLKAYGEGKFGVRKIDHILSQVIRPSPINFFDEAVNFTDQLSIYLYQHRIIFGFILLVLFVIIISLKVQWTRFRIIVLLFDVVFIISFMLTWWELLQEAEIKLSAQRSIYSSMPEECRKHEMSFSKSIMLFFGVGKGDCLKYYEAVMADPMLKVTPLHAISHMCTKFFFHPLSVAGQEMSNFIEDITGPLWFPFNHIAKLVLILFMPALLGTLLVISLGGSLGIRVGPLVHIYLHSNSTSNPALHLEDHNRQTIEVIRSDLAELKTNLSTSIQASRSVNQSSPKKIKAASRTEETVPLDSKKPEGSEANNDEFPEEIEYEKISRTRLEDEMNKETSSEISDSHSVNNKQSKTDEKSISSETNVKNKTSLDVKS